MKIILLLLAVFLACTFVNTARSEGPKAFVYQVQLDLERKTNRYWQRLDTPYQILRCGYRACIVKDPNGINACYRHGEKLDCALRKET